MRRTSPASASISEIDAICRRAVRGLHDAGATVEPVAFDVSDGRDPYQTWRGAWMVGQQVSRLSMLAQFGANLKGNVEAGLKVTALDLAKAEETRQRVFHRFRELFDRYDVLMTPAAPVRPYPVTMNFPREINGQTFENYIDWIAPAFLVTLVSLPAGKRAGRQDERRAAGRAPDRSAAIRGTPNPFACQTHSAGKPDRFAAGHYLGSLRNPASVVALRAETIDWCFFEQFRWPEYPEYRELHFIPPSRRAR